MEFIIAEAEILPEDSWFALGRIALFLRNSYPFPDVNSGAYGYEQDRESEIILDRFLEDLKILLEFLKTNPVLRHSDLIRLKEVFLNVEKFNSKSLTLEQQKYILELQQILSK